MRNENLRTVLTVGMRLMSFLKHATLVGYHYVFKLILDFMSLGSKCEMTAKLSLLFLLSLLYLSEISTSFTEFNMYEILFVSPCYSIQGRKYFSPAIVYNVFVFAKLISVW